MSDTPITDALERELCDSPLNIEEACKMVLESHHTLERELAEALARNEALTIFAKRCAETSSSTRIRREAKEALAAVKGGADE